LAFFAQKLLARLSTKADDLTSQTETMVQNRMFMPSSKLKTFSATP
jgi:hypothetical protein